MQSLVVPKPRSPGLFFIGSCDMSLRLAYGTNPPFPPLIEGPVAGNSIRGVPVSWSCMLFTSKNDQVFHLRSKLCYIAGIPRFGGRMGHGKAKLPKNCKVQGSYAIGEFERFVNRHFAEGHEVRMFLDPTGNSYALFCTGCDPRMTEALETHD
jgi:hypothetical protein